MSDATDFLFREGFKAQREFDRTTSRMEHDLQSAGLCGEIIDATPGDTVYCAKPIVRSNSPTFVLVFAPGSSFAPIW